MYQASALRFAAMLKNLSAILDKAQAHAGAKKIDELVLTSARLYPDMLALTSQVQIACDSAKGAVARLAGLEIPKHEDTEKTFDDLKARIAKTLAFIASVKPAQIDGTEDREVVLKIGGQNVPFKGAQYLLGYAWPNFYFHCAMTYGILRHNGIDLGKRDFLGNP